MSSPLLGGPGADNSVRPAREPDLSAIGAVHARSWSGPYAQALPSALVDALDPEVLAAAWRAAVLAPPTPQHRVHVAVGDGIVAGFVASAPVGVAYVDDAEQGALSGGHGPVTEIVALEVDPLHQRRGHGSRMLAAVVEGCRLDGTEQLHVWVHVDDAPRAEFLRGAGFEADGARRRRALDAPQDAAGADELARSVWPEVRFVAFLTRDEQAA